MNSQNEAEVIKMLQTTADISKLALALKDCDIPILTDIEKRFDNDDEFGSKLKAMIAAKFFNQYEQSKPQQLISSLEKDLIQTREIDYYLTDHDLSWL